MAGEDPFQVEGRVVEVLANRTYRVVLANGHRVLAFVAGRRKFSFPGFVCGDRVRLAMSPYDLSEGRILLEN